MTKEEAIQYKRLYDVAKELSDNLEEAYNCVCNNCSFKNCKDCVCKKWFNALKEFDSL